MPPEGRVAPRELNADWPQRASIAEGRWMEAI
jgi:hypothetical protein